MQKEIKVQLEDIERAITEIDDFLPNPRNFLEFEKDIKTKRAIERNIEIIGEAMSRIIKLNPKIKIENSRKKLIREIELYMDTTLFQMM